jgi:hypothetical protein
LCLPPQARLWQKKSALVWGFGQHFEYDVHSARRRTQVGSGGEFVRPAARDSDETRSGNLWMIDRWFQLRKYSE